MTNSALRHLRRALAASVMAIAFAGAAAPQAAAQSLDLRIMPPKFDYARICRSAPKLETDPYGLAGWNGGDLDISGEDLMSVAQLYRDGSAEVPPNRALAKRIFAYVAARHAKERQSAKFSLARLLLDEDAGPETDRQAATLLAEAAQARFGSAAEALAELYESGRGVPRDFTAAIQFYRLAAVEDRPSAAFAVARLYASGEALAPNPDAARQMAQLGLVGLIAEANSGNCGALVSIARTYERGQALRQDQEVASAWYLAAARAGDLRGMDEIADRYAGGIGIDLSLDKALFWWRRAAAKGSSSAALQVGRVYALGLGVTPDAGEAQEWLERAARGGSVGAMQRLAELWSGELPVTPAAGVDDAKAVAWYQRALEYDPRRIGVLNALARAYKNGRGVAADPARAFDLFSRAAQAGSLSALRSMAESYRVGQGVEANTQRAMQLFRQAATRGDAGSFGEIVEAHRCGLGVDVDPEMAQRWIERGAAQGVLRFMVESAEQLAARGDAEALAERRIMLLRAASGGSRKAMVSLAETYATGFGVEPDEKQVTRWRNFATAPGENQPEGLVAVAKAILEGRLAGTTDDAVALLAKASELGDEKAAVTLGRLLTKGAPGLLPEPERGVEVVQASLRQNGPAIAGRAAARIAMERGDVAGAAKLMAEAGAAGDRLALVNLAEWLGQDRPEMAEIAKQYPSPSQLLDQAAEGPPCDASIVVALAEAFADKAGGEARVPETFKWLDFALASFTLEADRLLDLGQAAVQAATTDAERRRGLDLMRQSADRGEADAMMALSEIYREGQFVPTDVAAAESWLKRAVDARHPEALYEYALALSTGRLGEADQEAAARYLASAAERGSTDAMRDLAKWRLVGFGGASDPADAVRLLEQAIAYGDPKALIDLADILTVGIAAEAAPERAIDLLQRAANSGNGEAMVRLSVAYATGLGVDLDLEKSDYWMRAAAMSGYIAGPLTDKTQ